MIIYNCLLVMVESAKLKEEKGIESSKNKDILESLMIQNFISHIEYDQIKEMDLNSKHLTRLNEYINKNSDDKRMPFLTKNSKCFVDELNSVSEKFFFCMRDLGADLQKKLENLKKSKISYIKLHNRFIPEFSNSETEKQLLVDENHVSHTINPNTFDDVAVFRENENLFDAALDSIQEILLVIQSKLRPLTQEIESKYNDLRIVQDD
ncbi:hypothetical protein EDEG_03015 [Edhazardia aedis USNM 41457]|uniref:Uncharacterized protein n=1 Tax=Edhazardia aedis (strain USNM 41457) TaxID=1003232 RepID=J9DML7_EDHAE|nr:hypothetical protein EDEG_03015 [Edhazardia aedis USNM 41457]|eukprot:EJW02582.1 hypothetical protein EDEG_03015 [Edhazardia aedis USNM 41457]